VWRWVLRIGLGIVVAITLIILFQWWRLERIASAGRAALAGVIAQTDSLDPGWRWEALEDERPQIPESENSARVIRDATAASGKKILALKPFPGGDYLFAGPANRRLDQERLAFIDEALKEQERPLALVVGLKGHPRGRTVINLAPDGISTLLPHVQNSRAVAELLAMDSERLLAAGQPAAVPARIDAILHAGAALRDEPFLISLLLRLAIRKTAYRRVERLLGMAKPTEEELRQLAAHFAAEGSEELLLPALRGERANYNILFENLESGRVPLAKFMAQLGSRPLDTRDLSRRYGAFLYRYHLPNDHAFLLGLFNEACQIATHPLHEQTSQWEELEQRVRLARSDALAQGRLFSCALFPAVKKVVDTVGRDQALLRCVWAALAAERYRLAHGRWPRELAELCPTFLEKVPADPFDGQPLRFARRADGLAIYSIDLDGRDDGGEILDPAQPSRTGKDLGIRLWDVPRRALPAEAPPKKE
jgi:hypothetical protein